MEVGAVKQAFNNELIRLKKNLNQARIQVIHKLTRKAKTLSERKAPEKLKDKFKRKAESAVEEVLIIKKIKIRDLAKFMLTHTGELNSFLNKPKVDTEKACARLLLHKSLNDKYKFIRNKFASIPINDLLMSREERRKLKKEAKEKQSNKKKGKNNPEKTDDDVKMANIEKGKEFSDDSEVSGDEMDEPSDNETTLINNYKSDVMNCSDNEEIENHDEIEEETADEPIDNPTKDDETFDHEDSSDIENDDEEQEPDVGKFVKLKTVKEKPKPVIKLCDESIREKPVIKKPKDKKIKDGNKNKNLNEKLLSRKFKKSEDTIVTENKVVDPFFITATGENYLSVAEPRAPDEFKEIHRQGNRQLRRAAMFGHAPKIKHRYDDFTSKNRFNQPNFEGNQRRNTDKFTRNNKFNKNERFNQFNANNDRSNFNNNKKTFEDQPEAKPEKLHPSWEAKKKQSGILPFQGKKIVFGDN